MIGNSYCSSSCVQDYCSADTGWRILSTVSETKGMCTVLCDQIGYWIRGIDPGETGVEQEITGVKQEMKQEITGLKQEITEVKQEVTKLSNMLAQFLAMQQNKKDDK
jgi:uncharacterized protein (DUF342 family)